MSSLCVGMLVCESSTGRLHVLWGVQWYSIFLWTSSLLPYQRHDLFSYFGCISINIWQLVCISMVFNGWETMFGQKVLSRGKIVSAKDLYRSIYISVKDMCEYTAVPNCISCPKWTQFYRSEMLISSQLRHNEYSTSLCCYNTEMIIIKNDY